MAITKFTSYFAVNSGQVLQPNAIPDSDKVMITPTHYLTSVSDNNPKPFSEGLHTIGFVNL